MINKCIGIISYLPENIKDLRFNKLLNLIDRCNNLFNLPIIIIAQNWSIDQINRIKNSNVIIYKYNSRLGIVGARSELRKQFLKSNYDYLIMLDDDIELKGDKYSANKYLSQIDDNPDKVGIFLNLTLQLLAISKEVYQNISFPNLKPENEDFFEDMWLIMTLKKKYPDRVFTFNRYSIYPAGDAARDPNSTWYHGQVNKHIMGNKTRDMVRNAE